MTRFERLKEKLLFNFILKVSSGYTIDGLVFVDEYFTRYNLIGSEDVFKLNFEDLSHIEELLSNSVYPKVLPENYHLNNNLEKFSDNDLFFVKSGEVIKIGASNDADMRIKSLKESMPCEFEVYHIKNKGFLKKYIQGAFSDFLKKEGVFSYNARFEKFIKENMLKKEIL